jgi:outer membrane protein OmpA-like peptidoglycan-associated protein
VDIVFEEEIIMKKGILVLFGMILVVTLTSCAGPTQQNRGAKTGAIIGTAAGALLGQAIGGNTEATLLGAGIGAAVGGLAGHQIGAYMDRQEQELRNAMAASDAASIQRTQNVLTATFHGEVFFDFDSYILKPGAYTEISRMAGVLNKYPQTTIRVEGHTDSKGAEDYNLQLSQKRAEAVKNALVQQGLNPGRIQTIGFGETQPISSNDAVNRRVNVVIIPIT